MELIIDSEKTSTWDLCLRNRLPNYLNDTCVCNSYFIIFYIKYE